VISARRAFIAVVSTGRHHHNRVVCETRATEVVMLVIKSTLVGEELGDQLERGVELAVDLVDHLEHLYVAGPMGD
jgi:hypothetical protein